MRASSSGPMSEMVARTGWPLLPNTSQNTTGQATYANESFRLFARSATFAFDPPAFASPARSPFTSAMNTGTPIDEKPCAIDWQRLGAILRRYLASRADEVLVIDDDPANRQVVRRHLEREGWAVTEAADGEEGLRAFAARKPGLILLDLMMPVLDGFGFLDGLGKRHPGHRVPVVVLTAKDLTPGDFDRLNGRVARILEKGDLNHLEAMMDLIRRAARR